MCRRQQPGSQPAEDSRGQQLQLLVRSRDGAAAVWCLSCYQCLCSYEVVAGLAFALSLLGHQVEVFLHPQHPQLGVQELLRAFYSGPVNTYADLPKAAEGFDTVVCERILAHTRT